MSYAEDFGIDVDYIDSLLEDRDEYIWTMKNGKTILVSDMSEEHIKNSAKMLNRKGNLVSNIWISIFEKELKKRKKNE